MNTLLRELRIALRQLRRARGFTAVAVMSLSLGIGANSTVFSWISSTLLNPVPGVRKTAQFVSVNFGAPPHVPLSRPDYEDLAAAVRSLSGFIAYDIQDMGVSTSAAGKPERVWGSLVSANYFDVLGVHPIVGRGFYPPEGAVAGSARVVVISYGFWISRMGRDRSIAGRLIRINQNVYTIIGVAPPAFQGAQTGLRSDIWLPLTMAQDIIQGGDWLNARGSGWLVTMGRLKAGVTSAQAEAELNALMNRIAHQYPDTHRGDNSVKLYPLWRSPWGANYYLHTILFMLQAIAGIVLLFSCTNVANLLLARSLARRRELAIRLSLGATRGQLVRQLLAESLLLALGGGLGAVVLTCWTSGGLSRFIPPSSIPIWINFTLDHKVIIATFAVALATQVLFGLLPAIRASRVEPSSVLKDESGGIAGGIGKNRLSGALVVVQVALSFVLLICAGLFIRSFRIAQDSNPGFNPRGVLLTRYAAFGPEDAKERWTQFDEQLLMKLRSLPGVQSVALSNWAPFGFTTRATEVRPEGYTPKPDEAMVVMDARVSPNYFRTLQIPLISGSDFRFEDTEAKQLVAIVNRAFADRFWPGQDPLGKMLQAEGERFTVIAIAQTTCYRETQRAADSIRLLPTAAEVCAWRYRTHAGIGCPPRVCCTGGESHPRSPV